jgi:hypothetical protein
MPKASGWKSRQSYKGALELLSECLPPDIREHMKELSAKQAKLDRWVTESEYLDVSVEYLGFFDTVSKCCVRIGMDYHPVMDRDREIELIKWLLNCKVADRTEKKKAIHNHMVYHYGDIVQTYKNRMKGCFWYEANKNIVSLEAY